MQERNLIRSIFVAGFNAQHNIINPRPRPRKEGIPVSPQNYALTEAGRMEQLFGGLMLATSFDGSVSTISSPVPAHTGSAAGSSASSNSDTPLLSREYAATEVQTQARLQAVLL